MDEKMEAKRDCSLAKCACEVLKSVRNVLDVLTVLLSEKVAAQEIANKAKDCYKGKKCRDGYAGTCDCSCEKGCKKEQKNCADIACDGRCDDLGCRKERKCCDKGCC